MVWSDCQHFSFIFLGIRGRNWFSCALLSVQFVSSLATYDLYIVLYIIYRKDRTCQSKQGKAIWASVSGCNHEMPPHPALRAAFPSRVRLCICLIFPAPQSKATKKQTGDFLKPPLCFLLLILLTRSCAR